MNNELNELIHFVQDNVNDKSMEQIQSAVEMYFNDIGWSLLKDEYEKMSEEELDSLYKAIKRQL